MLIALHESYLADMMRAMTDPMSPPYMRRCGGARQYTSSSIRAQLDEPGQRTPTRIRDPS
jgi:hypothetical protein